MKIISAHKYYYDRDGASHYQLEVNKLLEAAGNDIAPFAMDLPENLKSKWSKFFVSPIKTQDVSFGVSGIRTLSRMLYGWGPKDKMKALIKEFSPDIAHIHNIYTQISPSVLDALRETSVPAVMTVHDYHLVSPNYMMWRKGKISNLRNWGIIKSTLSRFHKNSYAASFAQSASFKLHKALRLYDRHISKFICPSEFVKEQLELSGYPKKKLQVLPHFIDLNGKEPSYEGGGSVLFVGRFVEEKGVRFLLDLAEEMSNTKFVLVGDGPLMKEVQTRSKDLDNVEVVGWVDRKGLAKYYRSASVVLVPSLWYEVFGLVALEATAYGKPVIVSDLGGLPEVVVDGETGYVCAAGDKEMWIEAIEDVLSDNSKAQIMGEKGRGRAEKVYAPEKHIEALEKIFREAV